MHLYLILIVLARRQVNSSTFNTCSRPGCLESTAAIHYMADLREFESSND